MLVEAERQGGEHRGVPPLDHALGKRPARGVVGRPVRRRVGRPVPPVDPGHPRLAVEDLVERLVGTRLRHHVHGPVPADLVRLDRRPVVRVVADLGEEDGAVPAIRERVQPVHIAEVGPGLYQRGHGWVRVVLRQRHVRVHAHVVQGVPEVDPLGLLEAVRPVGELAREVGAEVGDQLPPGE